jgi:Fcf2 pre-rRNA processing
MPKVELTEELKADLKALKLRNYIYPNRFYKTSDSKTLPKFFQIGTIVTDKNDMRTERLTKREAKGSLAEQFLRDDQAKGFSKRKYEQVNERNRRMGEKKRNLKINKGKHRRNNKFKSGGENKKKSQGKK